MQAFKGLMTITPRQRTTYNILWFIQ